jgi:DNA processing protein
MTVPDDERLARATLSYIAEPCDRFLGRMVRRLGPIGALDTVRAGHAPPGFAADGKERKRLSERMEWWRVRLPSAAPEADLTLCAKLGGRMVCPGDPEWPTQLDALEDKAPYALWLRGPADLRYGCLRSIAMVGARAATSYGVRVAADMGAELADRGCTVVSGGALGIDGAAHRGALAAGGTTVAVLANGVDIPYPPRNDGLLAEIAQTALLVSEWPPGTGPTRLRFLVRNRVIAALTKGTVVVEADLRSGALNTAKYAGELGRPVMAVPGPVSSVVSRGCHQWLRDGRATCVSSAAEVMETVGRIGDDLAPEPRGPILPRDELEPVTRLVLEAVPARGSAGPAQIAVRAGVDIVTARSRLGLLSAAGFIERYGQGWRLPRARRGRA